MTTIAYNHEDGEIAWDSRRTRNDGTISNDSEQKHFEVEGVHFWITGLVADQQMLIDYYFGKKSEFTPGCNCYAFDGDGLYFCGVSNEGELWKEPVTFSDATGSGGKWAIAAMDFGCSAKKAVKYAMTRDSGTGGKVRVFKLNSK